MLISKPFKNGKKVASERYQQKQREIWSLSTGKGKEIWSLSTFIVVYQSFWVVSFLRSVFCNLSKNSENQLKILHFRNQDFLFVIALLLLVGNREAKQAQNDSKSIFETKTFYLL
jgi:hypothetical protein